VSNTVTYDSVDSDVAYTVHGRAAGVATIWPYLVPTELLRGDAGSAMLPKAGRTSSARGFKVTTTNTMYQVGDVILFTSMPQFFYLESITDLGGGNYEHQWNALCYYTLSGGSYTPSPIWSTSDLPYYFPIGMRSGTTNYRFFKTTSGSADVTYVDGSGANATPSFTTSRKILWYGDNAFYGFAPLKPFPNANVKINTIVGSTITMSQNASITAWWADAPGLALVKLGA
jgi:hypothetical protein